MTNVLVVDAARSIRNSLKERLEYEHFRVDTAESKEEAIKKLVCATFQVVLCDHALPGKTSFDLLDNIMQTYPSLPVIILAQSKDADLATNYMRRGAKECLSNSVDMKNLMAVIRSRLFE